MMEKSRLKPLEHAWNGIWSKEFQTDITPIHAPVLRHQPNVPRLADLVYQPALPVPPIILTPIIIR